MPVMPERPRGPFAPREEYQARTGSSYGLLPLRFLSLEDGRYLLTNLVGEHLVLPRSTLRQLVGHQLPMNATAYHDLKSKHFIMDGDSTVGLDLLAAKYRTKQSLLPNLTSLFMLVTTLRCDHACRYCQVSHRGQAEPGVDMSRATADHAIEFMFASPSPAIKVEFQGGESLLHFDLVKHIVEEAEKANEDAGKDLQFVIATNLSALSDGMLEFCSAHDIFISTSLDGPRDLHNKNRPKIGGDSHEDVVRGIRRVREALGPYKVSALMTTTRESLSCPRQIVDEYVRQGFSSVFLRSLNPYGAAAGPGFVDDYSIEEWLVFYKEALAYIIELNRGGLFFREEFAALLLRKMLTPYPTGYVDLQSPAGIGIAGIVVNYDGTVYASDESRMLAEMGDKTFALGDVATDTYEDIIGSDKLHGILAATMTEGMPECHDCACQPYCGSDPVRHYRTQGDMVGFKPSSEFCKKTLGVTTHLVRLLQDDPGAADILAQWAQ
ncbi:MAG: His-Xaa-Ser system radical SAM maturase HxsB [Planctomycetota bacterium]|nr:His-Xaa-Ser system radical SAM maturase HxsB [Planctomycetota bacterium]